MSPDGDVDLHTSCRLFAQKRLFKGGGSWALQNPLATPLLVCRGKLLIRECEGCTGKECSKVAGNDLQ